MEGWSGAGVQLRPVTAANGALSSCTGRGGLRYGLVMGWRSNTQFQYKGASVFLQAKVLTGNGVGVKYPVISVANTVSSVSIQGGLGISPGAGV